MFNSLDEVKQAVEDNGGVITVEMRQLRDAFGAGKLGTHVLSGIASRLREMGLRTLPLELPNSQGELVRIFEIDNPVSELLRAIIIPSEENDDIIRRAITPTLHVKLAEANETKALRYIHNIIKWHFAEDKDEDEDFQF